MTKQVNFLDNPRHETISFDYKSHTYMVGDTEFKGVTGWIAQFCKPFNPKKIANKLSKMYGRPAQEFLDEWDERRDYGNYVHDSIELEFNEGIKSDSVEVENIKTALALYGLELIACEIIIFNEDFNRASAVDLLCVDGDGYLVVVDIKTRPEEIERKAYKNKTMSYPLDTLQDCRFDKYSLQVGLYANWLKTKYNAKVRDTGYILNIYQDQWDMIETKNVNEEIEKLYEFTKNTSGS